MSTAQDTLTVNTNCTVGYSVYVSATSSGDTNLTNDSAASNNVILPSSATVGGTSAVLSPNTWGINGSSSDVSENKYFGLPTYADATNNPLVTKSNVETETTVPIYYGAKVTTAVAPGTYSGDVLYTVLMDSSCLDYTVSFNANGGTGEMDNQTIPLGTATALSANAYTRSGYVFLGWSSTANGKTGNVVNGVGTMADVDYTDKQEVIDLIAGSQTKILYAIWAILAGDMQTWTGCPSLSANSIVYLNDTRDNTVYAVKKLPDGKCWMIQNLTIGSKGGLALNASNTNMQAGTTSTGTAPDGSGNYYLPPAGKQGAINSSSTMTSNTNVIFNSSTDSQAKVAYRVAGSTDNSNGNPVSENTGYYNYYTTSLGFSYRNDGVASGSSLRDICPKGWRLPKTTDVGTTVSTIDSINDFTYLAKSYNSDADWSAYQPTTTNYRTSDTTTRNNMISGDADSIDRYGNNGAIGFTYAGYYDSTTLHYIGTDGRYWSSSVYDANGSYRLFFNTTNVYPQSNSNKNYGSAVRCIAQNNYTVSYNANGGTGTPSKTSESGTLFETDKVTTATVNTMSKTGYHFLGWSTNSSATTAAYNAGTDVNMSTLISDAAASGQSTATGSTLTLYAVWAPNTFTISYSANSGSGSASGGTTSATYGVNITMASKGTLSRSGYDFLGWSLSSSATTATWTAGQSGIAPTSVKSNVTTVNGGSVTVYAVWKSKLYMQTTNCSDLTASSTTTLYDSRDEQAYTVYRWPSTGTAGTSYPSNMGGYCIMTKDLSLGYVTGGSVTKGANLTLTTSDSAAAATITARTGTGNWSTDNSDSNKQYINGTGGTYDSHSYYSYGAAQAVCPKGWRLPTNAEHGYIQSFMGGNNSTGSSKIRGTPYNFVYGGDFRSSGWYVVGSYGRYWSSTQLGSTYGYALYFNSSYLSANNFDKNLGFSVRCVSDPAASGCFTAGTQVQTTMDGETKAIEDIKIGDEVVSYDPEAHEYYMTEVIDTIVHDGEERFTKLAKLTLKNGATLEMTLSHPILTKDGYKSIQNKDYPTLTEDDTIITAAGEYGVSSIDVYDTEPTAVYNLTVKGRDGDIMKGPTHSYIANGIVVHNASGSTVI
ncbi:InlB B-repeat-containing protein [Candidatus Saccharibacteria bacterium]|nr:InlB B-repeat-containing protein [Candidatus Saccharibacteria bacterium]